MFCTRCGTKNPDNSANCYNCGHNMAKAPDRTLQTRSGSLAEVRPVAPPKEYGRVDVNGSPLIVTEQEISYQGRSIQTVAVTGIRFGIYKHYVNGIRTSQSYGIWVCDENDHLQIECAAGFLVSNSKIEQRYQDSLKALWPAVIVPLVSRFLEALDDGRGFTIGDVTFNKSGMHRAGDMGLVAKGAASLWSSLAGGKSAEERERDFKHLSWADYGGHTTASGQVTLFRNKKSWASFSLRDTWNAVCLDPLFSFLYDDGRLWKFVDPKRT
jgi:hypothetical protein